MSFILFIFPGPSYSYFKAHFASHHSHKNFPECTGVCNGPPLWNPVLPYCFCIIWFSLYPICTKYIFLCIPYLSNKFSMYLFLILQYKSYHPINISWQLWYILIIYTMGYVICYYIIYIISNIFYGIYINNSCQFSKKITWNSEILISKG